MNGKPFFDTNILIYAFSEDPRADAADMLLRSGGIVSVQVLNEFVNVSWTKAKRSWTEISQALELFRTLLEPPLPLTVEIHEKAITLAREDRLPFYDALIVAAAVMAECPVLYTEDMQHGRRIGELLISNPFLT
jgi:predicted nucleic acid-binding protein